VSPARLRLLRTERRTFAGPADFLIDPDARAHLANYLTDLTRPYQLAAPAGSLFEAPDGLGQSYGEMAEVLIRDLVPAGEPVELLVLAFAVPDMQPGRATATYLSHVCPGTPLSFAICEQGSAAAFSGLRVVRDYLAQNHPAGGRRALLLVVEQAVLPYPAEAGSARLPHQHQAVGLLFGTERSEGPHASVLAGIRQCGGVAPEQVPDRAVTELAWLTHELADTQPRLLLSESLAAVWPAGGALVAPAGQPNTGLWWRLLDELPGDSLVIGDYEPDLGYLSLAALTPS
jgi:4-hydroxymandelate oxidase